MNLCVNLLKQAFVERIYNLLTTIIL